MRKIKKLLCAALASTMVLAMAAPSFADVETNRGSISIESGIEEKTYTAYKIFDLTLKDSGENAKVSYSINANSAWGTVLWNIEEGNPVSKINGLTFTKILNEGKYLVVVDNRFTETSAAALAKDLKAALDNGSVTVGADEAIDVTNTKENLPLGYYFVTSTTGTLCSLDNTTPSATIREKNEVPTVDKKVDGSQKNTVSIGDTLNYTVTIDAKEGAQAYALHDTMTAGLTLGDAITVQLKKGEADPTDVTSGNYTIKRADAAEETNKPEDACTFEVEFTQAFCDTLADDDSIIISYSAVLNENAEIGTSNNNTAILEYGDNNRTVEDGNSKTETYTYRFGLVKTDASNTVLAGAKFKLYDAATDGNEIPLVLDGDAYRPAKTGETAVAIEAGNVVIKGLAGKEKYYLEETEAPLGYNRLAERVEVVLEEANRDAVVEGNAWIPSTAENPNTGVQVINETGTILPSTGGIGTTVFYAAGIILMAGAVFFVVRKKRV